MTLGVSSLDRINWALLLVSTGVTHVAAVTWWCHRGWIVQNGLIPVAGIWCWLLAGLLSLRVVSSSRRLARASSPNCVRAAKGHEWKL